MQNATTTPAIHLQPLPPSSTAAAPALTLTGQPSLVQPNNNLNNGQSMTSASMPSQPAAVTGARSIWTKITKWLFFFVKVLASLAVLVATYIALSVALWTSVKDFRDDCRSQNSTLGVLTQSCRTALLKPLSPPPFLHKSLANERVKRWLERATTSSHPVTGPTMFSLSSEDFVSAKMILAVGIFILFIFSFGSLRNDTWLRGGGIARSSRAARPHRPTGQALLVEVPWVANAVPRQVTSTFVSESTLRRRQRNVAVLEEESEGEWEPAGISAIKGDLPLALVTQPAEPPSILGGDGLPPATGASVVTEQSAVERKGQGVDTHSTPSSPIPKVEDWDNLVQDDDVDGSDHDTANHSLNPVMSNGDTVTISSRSLSSTADAARSATASAAYDTAGELPRLDAAQNTDTAAAPGSSRSDSEALKRMLEGDSTTTYWTPYAAGARSRTYGAYMNSSPSGASNVDSFAKELKASAVKPRSSAANDKVQ